VDGHPDAERQGALALGDVAVADAVRAVGGDSEVGVEPVEVLLGGSFPGGMRVVVVPVAMVELVGEVGVAVGPGADLGVGGGVAVAPVVGVEVAGLGGEILLG
jgi:hypothetical protein